jgi:hypothetical protein
LQYFVAVCLAIEGFKEYIERKVDYDYLVFVNHLVFTGPFFISLESYSPGYIENLVTILDFKKETPIMQFTFHATNSDKVFYLDRGDTTQSTLEDRLMRDIEEDQLQQFTLCLVRLGIAFAQDFPQN